MPTNSSAPPRTLLDALDAIVAQRGDQLAVRDREGSTTYTWRELRAAAERVAGGLAALGVGREDTVGLLLLNRPEFHVADLATVLLGAVPVSIYATSSPEQVAHVADDAGLRVLVVQAALLPIARAALAGRREATTTLVVLNDAPLEGEEIAWTTLAEHAPIDAPAPADPGDLLTIIYTSGTTGAPKGVELTHGNLMTATHTIGAFNAIEPGGRVICWLPMAHIAERIASWYAPLVFGLVVTTTPDPRTIGELLREVRPDWFFAVPRIWEKLRAGAQAAQAAGMEPTQLRSALGLDRVQAANVGAAPSAPELIAYFHSIGIPLAEIYGMSENCACCTCNPPHDIRVGTVGPALPGVELRIASDGEVLMRGATVMRGYRNRPDATAEAIDADGWLHTGDVGSLEDGYLKIIDRKKELIISSGGKNMSPSAIEAAIKTRSPLIGHICVVGDGRPYNVAVIVPDPDVLAGRAPDDPDVRAAIEAAVAEGNATLSRAEQVKRFEILTEGWAPGGEELTPTLKLRRARIEDRHGAAIEALYEAAS